MIAETFKLKPMHAGAVSEAIKKAERYRLLNEPGGAESICRDILRIQPDHHQALITIILALTDQFSREHGSAKTACARDYVAKLSDEYERLYYAGLVAERQARAIRTRGVAGVFAYDGLRTAMELYEKAEALSPEGNDDAILRWNSCVRTIRQSDLRPRGEEYELPLE
jgi:hypothetical protein